MPPVSNVQPNLPAPPAQDPKAKQVLQSTANGLSNGSSVVGFAQDSTRAGSLLYKGASNGARGIRVERDRIHRSFRPLHAVLASRPLVGIRRHVGAGCQFGQRERADRSLDRQVLRADQFEVDHDRGVEQPARDAASLRHAGLGQDQRWRRGRRAAGRSRLAARR